MRVANPMNRRDVEVLEDDNVPEELLSVLLLASSKKTTPIFETYRFKEIVLLRRVVRCGIVLVSTTDHTIDDLELETSALSHVPN